MERKSLGLACFCRLLVESRLLEKAASDLALLELGKEEEEDIFSLPGLLLLLLLSVACKLISERKTNARYLI